MKIRPVLFGYFFNGTRYVPVKDEAAAVSEIFNLYRAGETMKSIADHLNNIGIPYSDSKPLWDKSMVLHILDEKRYIGDNEYEPIITDETFKEVSDLRVAKSGQREEETEEIKWLKKHTYCSQCGNPVKRITHWRKHDKWICTKGCKTEISVTYDVLSSLIIEKINAVILNPGVLRYDSENNTFSPSLDVTRISREIERMSEQPNLNFGAIKSVILNGASVRYECCELDKSKEYTEALIEFFENQQPLEALNAELLKKAVKRIEIGADGRLTIQYINDINI